MYVSIVIIMNIKNNQEEQYVKCVAMTQHLNLVLLFVQNVPKANTWTFQRQKPIEHVKFVLLVHQAFMDSPNVPFVLLENIL